MLVLERSLRGLGVALDSGEVEGVELMVHVKLCFRCVTGGPREKDEIHHFV